MVAQLQGQFSLSNGHSQLKVMIKFLKKKKKFFILKYNQPAKYLECILPQKIIFWTNSYSSGNQNF